MAIARRHQPGHSRGIQGESVPVWQFYHYRRRMALEAQPNIAHKILAKLAIPSLLQTVAPAAQSFHLITQNVDRVSVIATEDLCSELSWKNLHGSENRAHKGYLIQMHGKLFNDQCTKCEWCTGDFSNSLCRALREVEEDIQNYTDAGSKDHDTPLDQLPHCPKCRATARPGVVWFGEKPHHLDEINSLVFKADMCLVIGTSSTVHSHRLCCSGSRLTSITTDTSSCRLRLSCSAPQWARSRV